MPPRDIRALRHPAAATAEWVERERLGNLALPRSLHSSEASQIRQGLPHSVRAREGHNFAAIEQRRGRRSGVSEQRVLMERSDEWNGMAGRQTHSGPFARRSPRIRTRFDTI